MNLPEIWSERYFFSWREPTRLFLKSQGRVPRTSEMNLFLTRSAMPLPQPRLFLSAHCLVFLLVVSAKFGYSLSKFFLPATKLRGGHDVIIGIDPCTELLELLKGDPV